MIVCGNGITTEDEHCDSSPLCDNRTCKCLSGVRPAKLGVCVGCGNGIKEGTEECDDDSVGCVDCKCIKGYTPSLTSTGCDKNQNDDGDKTAIYVSVGVGIGIVVIVVVVLLIAL